MTTFKITYNGNSPRFNNLNYEINAKTEREAVEQFYANVLNDNYYPQEDGTIYDQDGIQIAAPDDVTIKYDGGYFEAEQKQFTL